MKEKRRHNKAQIKKRALEQETSKSQKHKQKHPFIKKAIKLTKMLPPWRKQGNRCKSHQHPFGRARKIGKAYS